MADAARRWGRRALDFVDAVERLDVPDVVKLFESEIKACGFHADIMAGLPAPGTALSQPTIANGWPAEWFELYPRENFSALDRRRERRGLDGNLPTPIGAGADSGLVGASCHRASRAPRFGPGRLKPHCYIRVHAGTLEDNLKRRWRDDEQRRFYVRRA